MVICFLFLSHIQHCILHIAKQASCILHNNALVLRDGDLFLTHLLFLLQGEGSWVDPLWEIFLKQRKYSKQGIDCCYCLSSSSYTCTGPHLLFAVENAKICRMDAFQWIFIAEKRVFSWAIAHAGVVFWSLLSRTTTRVFKYKSCAEVLTLAIVV